jgi:sigma-B regulation protein RsbU (phosphoserine phosphatase)
MGAAGAQPAAVGRSVGFRLAVAVNAVMLAGVAGFLAFDYWRETGQRVAAKRATLHEEAMTIHQAVLRLREAPGADVQGFVDGVCGRMTDDESPGHHIVVEAGGQVVQSRAHGRDGPAAHAAVLAAADGGPGGTLVVGTHSEGGAAVYVAEDAADIRRQVRRQVLVRSAGVVAFGVALAAAVNLAVRRAVVRPLRRLARTVDAIAAGRLGEQAGAADTPEVARLAAAVNAMSLGLAGAEARRRAALERARAVQQNLLPRSGPAPGVCLAALHRPAEEVAGDYYDVLPAADGSVLVCVADVAGHGVAAAMLAAMLKVLLLEAAEADPDPAAVVGRVNRRFAAVSPPDDFASLFVARWDPAAPGELRYASAGHEPALLVSGAGPPAVLGATGTLVGVGADQSWDAAAMPVGPGALLLCLTDGVVEAMDPGGTLFGRDRLAALVAAAGPGNPEGVLARIDEAVRAHLGGAAPADDYTLVAVRFG